MKRLLLAIGLAATLVACTQKVASPAVTTPADPAAASASPPAAPAAAEAQQSPAATPADTAPAASSTVTPAQPLAGHWVAGTNYETIVPPQPTSVEPGQVEIIEFMWLGCPHCDELNPYIEAWKKKLPSYVKFRQEHVTWDPQRMPHARLFYTIEALGRDDLIAKAFDEIHHKGNVLMANSEAATEQLQQAFAVANGVSAADFQREYNGFAVATSLKRADDLVRRYRVDEVPTLIVNGKYHTDVAMAGSPEKLVQLLTDLAASEKAH